MSFIQDTDNTNIGKANGSVEGSSLPSSVHKEGLFAPCSFGRDIELLNANSCDEEGNPQITNETTSQLDGNDLHAFALANEFESIMNRASEISILMAQYYSSCGEVMGIELFSGIEEMRKTAVTTAEEISQRFPEDFEDEKKSDIDATNM
ncbi:hypothetical protein KBZ19_10810 [Synechococcus sp. L2F]|jgi:phage anti-repressor protein|uniref:hypothetical protein n=1 Tax=Synechococcus sp. L2F TaxID=2823739 RepID=UPI0020CEC9EC|nr:hypothetical protein [Synechococcus sp. L2F]MCP9828977.1 hypothetical protein [Synechococcus sp. L2F]